MELEHSEYSFVARANDVAMRIGKLSLMRRQGMLIDVRVKVRDQSFAAHKILLASRFPFFNDELQQFAGKPGISEITLDDSLDPIAVDAMIGFAYGGGVKISKDDVFKILYAAQYLKNEHIQDSCLALIIKLYEKDSLVGLHHIADEYKICNFHEFSNRYVAKSFEGFSKSEDFPNLPHSWLKEIISKDILNVSSEEVVFEAVVRWVKNDAEREVHLPELFTEVRLVNIRREYITVTVEGEALIQSSAPCKELIEKAKTYLSSPEGTRDPGTLKIAPRMSFECGVYGVSYSSVHSYVYLCDVEEGKWSFESARYEPSEAFEYVAAAKGKIYLFSKVSIITLNLRTNGWETLSPKTPYVDGESVVLHGDMFYFFGSTNVNSGGRVRVFDTMLNAFVSELRMPTARRFTAAVALGDYIYVTGGCNSTGPFTTVEKFSPTGVWASVPPMLTARTMHACATLNGKIYVSGGKTGDTFLRTAEMYDPAANQWVAIASMEIGRERFTLQSYGNKIFALNGQSSEVSYSRDIETYYPEADEWKPGCSLPDNFRAGVMVFYCPQ